MRSGRIIQKGRIIAEGSVDDLRRRVLPGAAEAASLEDLFLKLTGGEEYKELVKHLGSNADNVEAG